MLPLILRGTYETVAFFDLSVRKYANDHLCWYDLIMFFVGIVLVTFFQFSTMIFGFIRIKEANSKNVKVEEFNELDVLSISTFSPMMSRRES